MAWIAVGFGVGLIFVRRQRVLTDPLVDLRLFRSRTFDAALAATRSASRSRSASSSSPSTCSWSRGYRLSKPDCGRSRLPVGSSPDRSLLPPLVRHVRPAFVVAAALIIAAAGLGLIAQVDSGSQLDLVVVSSVVIAIGIAPPVTLATDLVVSCVRPERAGVASGLGNRR